MAPTSSEIMSKVSEQLAQEGLADDAQGNSDKLTKFILPALESSRNVQGALYSYEPAYGKSLPRKFKNFILSKLRNIVIGVMEKQVMKQQKVNELLYQAVVELEAKNAALEERINQLQK